MRRIRIAKSRRTSTHREARSIEFTFLITTRLARLLPYLWSSFNSLSNLNFRLGGGEGGERVSVRRDSHQSCEESLAKPAYSNLILAFLTCCRVFISAVLSRLFPPEPHRSTLSKGRINLRQDRFWDCALILCSVSARIPARFPTAVIAGLSHNYTVTFLFSCIFPCIFHLCFHGHSQALVRRYFFAVGFDSAPCVPSQHFKVDASRATTPRDLARKGRVRRRRSECPISLPRLDIVLMVLIRLVAYPPPLQPLNPAAIPASVDPHVAGFLKSELGTRKWRVFSSRLCERKDSVGGSRGNEASSSTGPKGNLRRHSSVSFPDDEDGVLHGGTSPCAIAFLVKVNLSV